MNPDIQTFTVIISLLGVFLIILSAFPQAALESGRQQIFELRDELFDYYVRHPDSMTREQYEAIRQHFHDVIRGMEYLTFWHVLLEALRKNKTAFSPKELISDDMSADAREKVKSLLRREAPIFFTTLIFRSMLWTALLLNILVLLMLTVGLYLTIAKGSDRVIRQVKRLINEIRKDALSAVLIAH